MSCILLHCAYHEIRRHKRGSERLQGEGKERRSRGREKERRGEGEERRGGGEERERRGRRGMDGGDTPAKLRY